MSGQVYSESLDETIARLIPQFEDELRTAVYVSKHPLEFAGRLIDMAKRFVGGSPTSPLARHITILRRDERGMQEFYIMEDECYLKIPNHRHFTHNEVMKFMEGLTPSTEAYDIVFLVQDALMYLSGEDITNPPTVSLS